MFKSFKLRTPDWIHFGIGAVSQVSEEARRLGAGRVMVLTDPGVAKIGLLEKVLVPLKDSNIEYGVFDKVEPEPTMKNFFDALDMAEEGKFDVFVAVGGGSSMDMTKLVSAMMTNEGEIQDYFGVDKVTKRGRPTIMITTTSGTGSEVTRLAVLTDTDANLKRVVSAQNILADVAIVDPEMTSTMPPSVTASTGIDAFIHAAESYIAVNASPLTDNLALGALSLIAQSLGPAFANGNDMSARYNMSLGSLMAGINLNNAGVGAVHALAYPIGGEYHISHGSALCVILGETMQASAIANLPKYRKMAEVLGVNVDGLSPVQAADAAVDAMVEVAKMVKMPTTLSDIKADNSKVKEWAEGAFSEKRLLGNTPRVLSKDDISEIFEKSF